MLRDFYCKDCGALIGRIGNDDLIVKCPKCRSLNNSFSDKKTESKTIATAEMGAKALRELGKELGVSLPATMSKADMANAINDSQK